jgi:hypothetical protein
MTLPDEAIPHRPFFELPLRMSVLADNVIE